MVSDLRTSLLPTPIQSIDDPQILDIGVKLLVKREDLIHAQVSGNKWRKLQYNLARARELDHNTLLTFGGAYSNHIFATAAAGAELGMKTVGIIRGEPTHPLNPTLSIAARQGMELQFISRSEYREKDKNSFAESLKTNHGRFYLLPEGGSNDLAVKGVSELIGEIDIDYDYICTPVGTGGTLAGILHGLRGKREVLGFPVVKSDSLLPQINNLIGSNLAGSLGEVNLVEDYHFGGYARFNQELIDFINRFRIEHQLQLDPIYTGKMFFGLFDMIKKGVFSPGSTVLALHTGGLQGIVGFNQRFGDLIH